MGLEKTLSTEQGTLSRTLSIEQGTPNRTLETEQGTPSRKRASHRELFLPIAKKRHIPTTPERRAIELADVNT